MTHLFRDLGYILWDEIAIMEAAREAELQEGSKDVYDLSRREQLHVGNLDDIMLSRDDGPWRLAFCSQQY